MAEGDDPQSPPRTVVAVNLTPRPLDNPRNLDVDPEHVRVVDASVLGPGGMVENLHPKQTVRALAAATSGGNPDKQAVHADVIGGFMNGLTEAARDPDTGKTVYIRPDIYTIVQAVGVADKAREDEPDTLYPEAADLTPTELKQVYGIINSDRHKVNEADISQLRARLDRDVLPDAFDAPVDSNQAPQLFPALTSGVEAPRIAVDLTRVSVEPDSQGTRHDAQVRGAVTGLIGLVVGEGHLDEVVLEGAEEIAERDTKLLGQLVAACALQEPPTRLTLTFTQPVDSIAPFVAGDVTIVKPENIQAADGFARFAPKLPMADATSLNNAKDAGDNTSFGASVTVGYDPEKTNNNGGTNTNSGTSGGMHFAWSETTQVNIRPPYGRELMKGIGSWQAARWDGGGEFDGVRDVRSGKLVARGLPNMMSPTYDARPDIDAIQKDQEKVKEGVRQKQGGQASMYDLPTPPAQPMPAPGTNSRTGDPTRLRLREQLPELAVQEYGHGRGVDHELLAGPAFTLWARENPQITQMHRGDAQRNWVEWLAARNQGTEAALRAWDTRVARIDAQREQQRRRQGG
jgi:hypothetical protein